VIVTVLRIVLSYTFCCSCRSWRCIVSIKYTTVTSKLARSLHG